LQISFAITFSQHARQRRRRALSERLPLPQLVTRGRALATGAREAFGVERYNEARKQLQAAKPELPVHDRVARQRSSTFVVAHDCDGVGG
jgi:hypothetical protein